MSTIAENRATLAVLEAEFVGAFERGEDCGGWVRRSPQALLDAAYDNMRREQRRPWRHLRRISSQTLIDNCPCAACKTAVKIEAAVVALCDTEHRELASRRSASCHNGQNPVENCGTEPNQTGV